MRFWCNYMWAFCGGKVNVKHIEDEMKKRFFQAALHSLWDLSFNPDQTQAPSSESADLHHIVNYNKRFLKQKYIPSCLKLSAHEEAFSPLL